MQEIKEWLHSKRDYATGVQIYDKHGKYVLIKKILKKGPTPLTIEKLHQLMSDLWQQVEGEVKVRIAQNENRTESVQNNSSKLELTPPSQYILDLDKIWKPAYAEMAVMHSRLVMANSNEARYALATHITHLEQTCIDCWQKRDYFIKEGKPMPVKEKRTVRKDISNTELRSLLNARSGLSQYKNIHLPKALANLNARPSKKAEKRVQNMHERIKHYQNIIKSFEQ